MSVSCKLGLYILSQKTATTSARTDICIYILNSPQVPKQHDYIYFANSIDFPNLSTTDESACNLQCHGVLSAMCMRLCCMLAAAASTRLIQYVFPLEMITDISSRLPYTMISSYQKLEFNDSISADDGVSVYAPLVGPKRL